MDAPAVVKLVHLLAMAVWIGAGLTAPWGVLEAVARGKPHAELHLACLRRLGRLLIGAGVLTVATGFALIVMAGGFKAVPSRVHLGLAITLVIFAVGPFTHLALERMRRAVLTDDLPRAAAIGRNFRALSWVEEALRIAALAAMVEAP